MSEEDKVCPICLEHPQNAILLVCSSHDKGCRPFMCDTNCFQQFCKFFSRRKEEDGSKLLMCPLCRGSICGSVAKNNDSSTTSYSCFNCDFSAGMYQDLGMHVSSMHPDDSDYDSDDDSRDSTSGVYIDWGCDGWESGYLRRRAELREWLEDPQGVGRQWWEALQARRRLGNDDDDE